MLYYVLAFYGRNNGIPLLKSGKNIDERKKYYASKPID